jgi:heme/copper-type cytochrome/quinol oxidase subunit 2
VVPFFVAMAIFVWATAVFFHIIRPPDQTLEIHSSGKRWMWRFQHVGGQGEINELHEGTAGAGTSVTSVPSVERPAAGSAEGC